MPTITISLKDIDLPVDSPLHQLSEEIQAVILREAIHALVEDRPMRKLEDILAECNKLKGGA